MITPFSFIKNSIIYDTDAAAFFARSAAAGYIIPNAEKSYYNDVIIQLKNILSRNGTTSLWTEIDVLKIYAVSKITSLLNIKTASFGNGTIVNDYVGSWADATGFTGNGTNFSIASGYNPGNGGSYKYTQNSACLYMFNTSTALTTGYSIGVTNSGSTAGSIITAGRTNRIPFMDINVASFASSNVGINLPSNKVWVGMARTASNAERRVVNGASLITDAHVSTTITNFEFQEFARNRAATIQDFSNNSCGGWFAGSKDINEFKVQAIIEQYFLKPRGLSSWMPNRLTAIGDSMTASGVNGNYCQWSSVALSTLGSTWQGHADGLAGGTIIGNIEPISVNNVDPYVKPYLTRDILTLLGGTNDLSSGSTVTGTDIYNRYKTWVTNRRTNGYSKFILMGMMDRQASFTGGQNQAGFNAGRLLFNNLMLADFTVPTSVTNVYTSTLPVWAGCCFIDQYADVRFQDSTNTGYFLGDNIHPNTTLDGVIAGNVVAVINANIV